MPCLLPWLCEVTVYRQSLVNYPNNGWALYGLAEAYAEAGDDQGADQRQQQPYGRCNAHQAGQPCAGKIAFTSAVEGQVTIVWDLELPPKEFPREIQVQLPEVQGAS